MFISILFTISLLGIVGSVQAQSLSCIQPKNGMFLEDFQVDFSWNSMPNGVNYTVQISQDINFILGVQSSPNLTVTNWHSFNLINTGMWYWKVIGND